MYNNPVEKYLNETGQTTLLVKIDKFLNEQDIEFMERICNQIKDKLYFEQDTKTCIKLLEKLDYIKELLK